MTLSGAAFVRRFVGDDSILRKIDKRILRHSGDGVVYESLCSTDAKKKKKRDQCSSSIDALC